MMLDDKKRLDKELNLEGKKRLVAELRGAQTPEAVALLFEILNDESWYLREMAVDALVECGRPVVPSLLDVLVGGLWYSRACAAIALGRLGAAEAAGPVAAMLTDSNRTVAEAATSALAALAAAGAEAAVARGLARAGSAARRTFLEAARLRNPSLGERVAGLLADEAGLARERPEEDVVVWENLTTS